MRSDRSASCVNIRMSQIKPPRGGEHSTKPFPAFDWAYTARFRFAPAESDTNGRVSDFPITAQIMAPRREAQSSLSREFAKAFKNRYTPLAITTTPVLDPTTCLEDC